uniref:Alpha-1,3-glucosyltransferase n=1 Tax=Mucochytrium quahogii TaxID=96639 RepID=A0A7S2WKC5_9STRA|mmetsp:Transcript_17133/g.29413  ORF Transcript_17133/g.29413 Transcript_17133/m.29413 type:complete len:709 (-) Transcript_17133:253-2379(-)|eukprot:CAMPEP_0203753764 /NCGR_PEP_ID=MMETSP0098-20131031/7485_1 /ASSEMBLY_ACC=CAM_ASM_000208 /TAXON_ID=96639 /ORGANISM=" , Strain NY0313808BC1" /LENGTH=708 /DNA_ID=CAMNT_0050644507 /DNA_START=258 /DNA_END=2384 /DNA_ORIENTATION=-
MPTTGESVGVIFGCALALKSLLLPSYQSVEFDLHKSWLMTTYSLPCGEWYFEEQARFPIDYPPVFAYFKYCLSVIATWIDQDVWSYGPMFWGYFNRLTVILTDPVLLLGVLLYSTTWPLVTTTDMAWSRNKVVVVAALISFNPGLIFVDHIHLHYSGLSIGILLISIAFLRRGDGLGDIVGIAVFVFLLVFDCTFLPVVPLYGVYVIRHYCCVPSDNHRNGGVVGRHLVSMSSSDGISDDTTSDAGNEEDDEDEDYTPRRRRFRLSTFSSSDRDNKATGTILKHMRQKETKALKVDNNENVDKNVWKAKKRQKNKKHGKGRINYIETDFRKLLVRPRPRGSSSLEVVTNNRVFRIHRFAILVFVVFAVLSISTLPIVWSIHKVSGRPLLEDVAIFIEQLGKRLFPQNQTMCLDYWAPNMWALYMGLDKILALVSRFWGLDITWDLPNQDSQIDEWAYLQVLPIVRPWWATLCMFLSMFPALKRVWNFPHLSLFLPAYVYCMTCAFMFGFHVHEKSVLMIVVPLTLASCDSTMDARLYLLMSWIAHVSLIPLLETPDLKALKPVLLCVHCFASYVALDQYHIMARKARRIRPEPNGGGVSLGKGDRRYFIGLAMVYFFAEVLHPILPFLSLLWPEFEMMHDKYAFLPRMVISLYCATGMFHCWTLAMQQVSRKISVIASYQWSPKAQHQLATLSDGGVSLNEMSRLSLF